MTCWTITPSDLSFGIDCLCCFHAKKRLKWKQPYQPFPTVFTKLDQAMRRYWDGQNSQRLDETGMVPFGKIETKSQTVKSRPMILAGCHDQFVISGKLDALITFTTQSYGVLDFKTSKIEGEHTQRYFNAMSAYCWGLENPAPGSPLCSPISHLGLLIYEPDSIHSDGYNFSFRRKWIPIGRDDQKFLNTITQLVQVLEQPIIPFSPNCDWCKLRQASMISADI